MSIASANYLVRKMLKTSGQDNLDLARMKLPLKVGIDLGTSNIVITVLDNEDTPVAYALEPANVVRDGIVVNFVEATHILSRLKADLEERLGLKLSEAATGIPPNIIEGNVKIFKNVVIAAGFEVVNVVNEPEAAAIVIDIEDGVVVDIGGGTTGVSVIREKRVVRSIDEPTGGTHMTLVVAGNIGLDFANAERFKIDPNNAEEVFPMIRPVIEKMAQITKSNMPDDVNTIYLAGGASCFDGIDSVFQDYTGVETKKTENPLLITPIGIATSITWQEV